MSYSVRVTTVLLGMLFNLLNGQCEADALRDAPTRSEVESARPPKAASDTVPSDSDFTLTVALTTDPGGKSETLTTKVLFVGRYAIDPEIPTIFDLEQMVWHDVSSNRKATLRESEKWAEANTRRTQAALEKIDNQEQRRLVQALLKPDFRVESKDGSLSLTNDVMKYTISSSTVLPEKTAKRFFAYDRLNGYHKSIMISKLPPFAQLEATKQLESRRMLPREMSVSIKTSEKPVTFRAELQIREISARERSLADRLLRENGYSLR